MKANNIQFEAFLNCVTKSIVKGISYERVDKYINEWLSKYSINLEERKRLISIYTNANKKSYGEAMDQMKRLQQESIKKYGTPFNYRNVQIVEAFNNVAGEIAKRHANICRIVM